MRPARHRPPELETIDLHSLRRDEIESYLDRELNRLFMANERECRVIVGRGKVVAPLAYALLSVHPLVDSIIDQNGSYRVWLESQERSDLT